MGRLDGQVAVVTGAGTGIGAAIARTLAREGAFVAVTDINEDWARRVAEEIRQAGGTAEAWRLDVTKKAENVAVMDAVVAKWGSLDIVCANAGVSTMNWVEDLAEEEWDYNFNVNAKGVFLTCQASLPHMIRKGGRIIITASMAGHRAVPLLAHYAASKWAVIGFGLSLAVEVGKYNIKVNIVCPGFVRTSMQEREIVWEGQLRGMDPEAVRAEYVSKTPLGRIEEPQDVANVVLLLCLPEADFITGAVIDVTGGAHLT
ncbi:MAG: 3-ketoacyl-ACP reductase [Thermoflexus sp.]|uniref:SDR family NAD(P)-dependent oxidoreductase n=1 Tax=Thermoflexus sp. TaxID=1969742 RepID=UPI0033221768